MQILIFASVFNGAVIGVNALWSMKIWKYMIIYQTLFGFLLFICPFIGFNLFNNKIIGISFGVLVSHLINLLSGIYITYLATHKN